MPAIDSISWITVIWAMIASACLTLCIVHLMNWWRQREVWAHLLFSLTALGVALMSACELWLMRSGTVEEYGLAARMLHLPAWLLIVSLAGFVLFYMEAGRLWLAFAVIGTRTLALILNFCFSPNLNYREITSLVQIRFLGESVVYAQGVPNPWMLIGQASLLLLLIFVVDASLTVWRRGDRRQSLYVGGSIVFFTAAGLVITILTLWHIIHVPFITSPYYLAIIATMGYELSDRVIRAARLANDLRESEERMSLATEAAGLGIWIWDLASNRIWGSEKWYSLFGYEPGAMVSFDNIIQRIHPDDREMVVREFRAALENHGEYVGEFRVVQPDGAQHWVAARGRLHPGPNGKPSRMMGASLDVTQRKHADLELQRNHAEIAHLSRVTMLGELSGSLAHELNQPLTAILSNAQAALRFITREDADLDEVQDILQDIVTADQRAVEVINGLRLLLKKGEVNRVPLDLNDLVQDTLKLVRNELLNHDITLQTSFESGMTVIQGDRVQLQQVLLNLIVNASDAMMNADRADRTLVIRTESTPEGGVRVSVIDRGTGLSPEVLERLFDPYFTTKPSGMGLGLKVCRTIIEAHGGYLIGENNSGPGAVFHFTLPGSARASGQH